MLMVGIAMFDMTFTSCRFFVFKSGEFDSNYTTRSFPEILSLKVTSGNRFLIGYMSWNVQILLIVVTTVYHVIRRVG